MKVTNMMSQRIRQHNFSRLALLVLLLPPPALESSRGANS